jgi:hypothetical protein
MDPQTVAIDLLLCINRVKHPVATTLAFPRPYFLARRRQAGSLFSDACVNFRSA